MNVTTIQQRVHQIYEGSSDYPNSTEEDYIVRLGIANIGVDQWASENDWEEIKETETGTLTALQNYVDKPTDFLRCVKDQPLLINNTPYQYVSKSKAVRILLNNPAVRVFWLEGTKIYFNFTPDGTESYELLYVRNPHYLTTGTDVPEMSDGLFLVYTILSMLYEQDNRNDLMQYYQNKASEVMGMMHERFEQDQLVDDGENSEGFGE
jgi:hypothetical protein